MPVTKRLAIYTLLMRNKILILVACLIPLIATAQSWKSKPFSISLLNNATLYPPKSLTAVFNQPLHPGFSVNYEFGWRETIKDPMFRNINTHALGGRQVYTGKWFQNFGLTYYYHRYVNHAVLITTQAGYRRYLGKFSAEASLHAGYMHAFLLTGQFVKNSDGTWNSQKLPTRAQIAGGAGIGIGYDAGYHYNSRRIFINYDFRLQVPFIKNYVPLLPNGILSAGIQFTLFKNPGSQSKPATKQLECPKS